MRDCECCRYKKLPKPKVEDLVKEVINRNFCISGDQKQKVLVFPSYLYRLSKNVLSVVYEIKSKSKYY